jgi:ligand-binding sensor domain-containing protein
MNPLLKQFSILFCFILSAGVLDAQRFPFTTITNKEGLPQSSVFKTVQDHQGYIWVATEAGLCRYDGYEFKNYSYFSGLDANFIFDIEFDKKGRLWVGSFGTGISVYDGTGFYTFNTSNGFPANFVIDIHFSSSGDLWVASKENGIFRTSLDYEPKIQFFNKTGVGFYGQKITELPNGDMLGAGDGGVYQYVKENNYEPVIIHTEPTISLLLDNNGGLWTGGNHRLFYIKDKIIIDHSDWVIDNSVLGICKTSQPNVIYFCTETGLITLKDTIKAVLTTENGLSYSLIKDVNEDRFGNIWVSTYGNGATLLDDKGMTHYDSDGKGGDLCAFSIGEEKDGKIWIGKYFGGYFEVTSNGISKTKIGLPDDANPLSSYTDDEGNVYLISNNEYIYKISDGKLSWSFQIPFKTESIFGVLKLKDEKILVTGTFGCMKVDEKNNQWEFIRGTENIFMKEPFYDEYGAIWLLGELGDLYKIQNNGVEDYTMLINPTRASVTHGMYDKLHHLWWITTARGVLIWNGMDILQLHSGNGLKSDLSFSVVQDKLGKIWIGQVQGIACIDVETKQIKQFGYDQGFQPVETNAGAAFVDSKGNVWFGTLTSASKIDVTRIGKDSTTGILRLKEIEINNQIYYTENYNDTTYPKLYLKHYQNNLDFQFASLCYTNAKDVKYSWRMEGLDKHWITKTNTKEVNYSNLDPGDYTFMVEAINPNGYVTNRLEIKIEISQPFWNRPGFYLFEILVFLFIVFLSFRFTRQSSNNRLGQIMTLLTIFIIFESAMLYISHYTDKFTNGIPIFQLVMNVILAASLHPLETRIRLFMRKIAKKKK